ncbi:uncharacterized protein EAF02_008569 [Botrytis sinoallii]|uniref:uncharacterized protein n=1 Tax=Botrytis sinoallii TaxID=1463999 RepID=UPI00190131A7|nr:uncharacterized protein EAF02_008569 [Botrytis sinoallii]KAF7874592.1 hypothetical protein EAF02_008569 [Botrytis sinoallii]
MENHSKSKSNATMRTYSKRTRGSNQNLSNKRQRVDASEFVSISSPVLSEPVSSPKNHSRDRFEDKPRSPLIRSPSKQPRGEIENFSTINSRVLSPRSVRSISPLTELKSNQQNRRDNEINSSYSPDSLKRKSSTKIQGAKLTSTPEASNSMTVSRSSSRLQHKTGTNTTKSPSPVSESIFSKESLASNHTRIDSETSRQNPRKSVTSASKKRPISPSSEILTRQDTTITSKFHPVEKANKSSIRSYFKPLPQPQPQRSSSPPKSQSSTLSDSSQHPVSSPPSSPPPIPQGYPILKRTKSVRRRISTKPNLPKIDTMSEIYEDDLQELCGDFTDDSRVELMERYQDAQDMRDQSIIDHGTLIPLADQALEAPERARLRAEIARPMGFALHQQILDLGQSFSNKCPNCGMQYAINDPSDQRMHDQFHKIFKLGGPVFKPKYVNTQAWQKIIDGELHTVQCISCKESGPVKSLVESILEATLMDMDGILPTPARLWSMITSPNDSKDLIPVPRYKVFLYVIGARPIGILLAERIGKATPIMNTAETAENASLSTSLSNASPALATSVNSVPQEAYMCIDRLWVHSDFRRKGIATSLANQAREKFIPGLIVEKNEMAISHPTSVGGQFAEKYFKGVFEGAKYAIGCL